MSTKPGRVPRSLLIRSIVRILVGCALIAGGLFWTADTADWPEAWLLLAFLVAMLLASAAYLWRANPEIFVARDHLAARGTKPWDYAMLAGIVAGFTMLVWVAGFDYRFGWSPLPVIAIAFGYLLLAMGNLAITVAQAANRHFEPSVRIQADRAHSVMEGGPYAFIRHPGYAGGALIVFGMALALASGWALLPAAFVIGVLVLRTVLEERTLREELAGYAAYSRRVKWRWIPGIW